jgi:hypothetical protein
VYEPSLRSPVRIKESRFSQYKKISANDDERERRLTALGQERRRIFGQAERVNLGKKEVQKGNGSDVNVEVGVDFEEHCEKTER